MEYSSGEAISSSLRYISVDRVVRGIYLVGIVDRGSSSGGDNEGRHCSTPRSQPNRYSQGNKYIWLPIEYTKSRQKTNDTKQSNKIYCYWPRHGHQHTKKLVLAPTGKVSKRPSW